MKYNDGYLSNSNGFLTTKGFPLDVRLVQSSKSDLIDYEAFGDDEYRYVGMIVAVVEDSVPENNGVYLCISDDFNYDDTDYNCWQKLLDLPKSGDFNEGDEIVLRKKANGNFEWAKKTDSGGGSGSGVDTLEELNDVDVTNKQNGYVLKYNSTTQKWEAAPDERGSGSGSGSDGGVTTNIIDYSKIFESPSNGGLGYSPTPSSTRGLGYLKPDSYPNSQIPAGTSYEAIFRKILCGANASISGNLNYTVEWDGTQKSYTSNVSPVANPSGAVLQYSIGSAAAPSSTWINYAGSSITGTNVETKYIWFKSVYTTNDGTVESSPEKGTFSITKRTSKITPTTSKDVYTIGETISFGTPTITKLVQNIAPSQSDIVNMLTYSTQNNSVLNTVGTINITVTNINTLNSTYTNYSFSSGTKTITVKPVIQFKTFLDSDWCDYLTSYNSYNSGTYAAQLSSYNVQSNSPNNSYMLPVIHNSTPTSNHFQLRIKKPYKLGDTKYEWDGNLKNWNAVADTAYTEFVESSDNDYNIYQYTGNNVAVPLAITITKNN